MAKPPKESDIKELCYPQTIINSQHFRPLSYATIRKRKLQHLEQHQHNTLQQPKGPAYWDNLSVLWFTKGALRELDRRNNYSAPKQEYHRPVTRQFVAKRKKGWRPRFAPNFLRDCSPSCLKQLERLSRRGGPDLSDLRNYPDPRKFQHKPIDSGESQEQGPLSLSPPSMEGVTNTKITTAYSRNFQQHLIDHGIYPDGYEYPDSRIPALPDNLDDIKKRLMQRRPSLSPSRFTSDDFREFRRANKHASNEDLVITEVAPEIEGDNFGDPKCRGRGYLFTNLAPLTDGSLASAKPDRFYGARPEQLNRQIRMELSNLITPSKQDHRPIVPNFFLEAKGPDGTQAVVERQACYDGALGARAMHTLQSYQQERPAFDNNGYTITSTYASGMLTLYTTHLIMPSGPGCRPEYIMTHLDSWSLTGNPESFRQGVSAYRNARDWAKEKRDEFIRLANERHLGAQSQAQHSENVCFSQ